jgi:CRISPR-associated protein Csb1
MANRLEEVCLANRYTGELVSDLAGLPYLQAKKGGKVVTASTIDGHRFASEYLMTKTKGCFDQQRGDEELVEYLKHRLESTDGDSVPAENVPVVYEVAMELDPLSLIHGFQISLKNRFTFVGCRSPRALCACIVGRNSQPVPVPGVRIDPIGTGEAGQAIFRKERIVAEKTEALFTVDVGLLRSLRLSEIADLRNKRLQLLVALAVWKVARLLREFKEGNRLRTDCDLRLKSGEQLKYRTSTANTDGKPFPFDTIAATDLKPLIDEAKFAENRSPLTLAFGW